MLDHAILLRDLQVAVGTERSGIVLGRLRSLFSEGRGQRHRITWYRYAYDAFASHGITTPKFCPGEGKAPVFTKIYLYGLVTAAVAKFYGDRKIVAAHLSAVGELNEKLDPRKFGRRA